MQGNTDDDATEELPADTKRFMYDRMTDYLRVRPVDECVRDLVAEMKQHPREYGVPTRVLVDAAYDAAAEATQEALKENAPRIVAEVSDK
jgi:hypothetical protein